MFVHCDRLADVEDAVALFERANDAFAEFDSASLSEDELGELLVGWQQQMARAAAGMARAVAAYDGRKAYRSDGSRSAAVRLARDTRSSPAKMRGHVALGRRLRLMPKVAAALAAGEIAEEHARLLGRLAASQRKVIADAFVECEDELLGFAKDLEFDEFVKVR
jgi:hypothetical protein